RVRHQLGLDKPLWEQYLRFLWGAVRGDFGNSFYYQGRSVSSIIRSGLPVSATLGLLGMTVALVIAIPLGVLAALRQHTWVDYASMLFAVGGVSFPLFVTAPILIWLFALKLDLLPVAGWGSPQQAIIPAIVLGIRPAAVLARQVRQSVIEVLTQDYVRTARAKGITEWLVIVRHVMRNALIPVVTLTGLLLAGLMT